MEAVPLRAVNDHLLPTAVAGDKGYTSQFVRAWLNDRGVRDVIPTQKNQKPRRNFSRKLYRERNVIERCIGWLKECRRIATRYEKLAVRYLAMVKLGMIREYLKYDLSNTP